MMFKNGDTMIIPQGDSAELYFIPYEGDEPFMLVDGESLEFCIYSEDSEEPMLRKAYSAQDEKFRASLKIRPGETKTIKRGQYYYKTNFIDENNVITIDSRILFIR